MLIRSANYIGLGFYFIATTTFANRGSPRSTIPVETCPTAGPRPPCFHLTLWKTIEKPLLCFKNMTTPLILCPDFSTWKLPTVGFKQKFNYMFCFFRDVHSPPTLGGAYSHLLPVAVSETRSRFAGSLVRAWPFCAQGLSSYNPLDPFGLFVCLYICLRVFFYLL